MQIDKRQILHTSIMLLKIYYGLLTWKCQTPLDHGLFVWERLFLQIHSNCKVDCRKTLEYKSCGPRLVNRDEEHPVQGKADEAGPECVESHAVLCCALLCSAVLSCVITIWAPDMPGMADSLVSWYSHSTHTSQHLEGLEMKMWSNEGQYRASTLPV